MKHPFKEFFSGLIAQGVGRTATPTESQDTTARVVRMPLRELIDSLALLDALKSEEERWVEIVNFPEYGTFSVEFLRQVAPLEL